MTMKKEIDFSMVNISMDMSFRLDTRKSILDDIEDDLSNFVTVGGDIKLFVEDMDDEDDKGDDIMIGEFSMYIITGDIHQIIDALDCYSITTMSYMEELYNNMDDYYEILFGHEKLIVLNRVEIVEDYRGNGLIQHLIRTIDRIYHAPILIKPFPLQFELTPENREEDRKKLGSIKPHINKVIKSYEKCDFFKAHKKSEYMVRDAGGKLEEIEWV